MNSLPEAARGVADGIRNATGDLARGAEDAEDKVGQAAGDLARGADDAMRGENGTDGTMDQSIGNTPDNNNSSTEENGRGVIGWVIAILVVLAIALVVLAMLPKKSHERH